MIVQGDCRVEVVCKVEGVVEKGSVLRSAELDSEALMFDGKWCGV